MERRPWDKGVRFLEEDIASHRCSGPTWSSTRPETPPQSVDGNTSLRECLGASFILGQREEG